MNRTKHIAGVGVAALCMSTFCALALAEGDEPAVGDKTLSQQLKELRSDNRGFQLRAARALAEAPKELWPKILPQVLPVLKSERENDKFVAAQVLGEYGPIAKAAVPDLLPMLKGTQYERNRAAAAKALGQILKGAPESEEIEKVTKELVSLFDDKYMDVRREAVTACGMIGLAAKSCIPSLGKRIGDAAGGDSVTRHAGKSEVWACGEFGPLAAVYIDRLISIMHGGPVAETIEAIGKIGAVNDNVVKNIVDRMEVVAAGNVIVQEGSRTRRINGEEMRANIIAALEALAKFGAKSEPSIPYLKRMITTGGWHKNKEYAVRTMKVFGAIGPGSKDVIETIEQGCLKSSDADIKKAAEEALAKIKGK